MRKPVYIGLLTLTLVGTPLAFTAAQPPENDPNQPARNPQDKTTRTTGQQPAPGATDSAVHHRLESKEMRQCLELCGQCAAACERTSTHCLTMGGQHVTPDHQNVLRDCADICSTAACFLARGSERHTETCRLCAEICEACAKECERLGSGDEMMTECAKICRDCAESCRKMAAMS
jgi:hypothetical protein